MSFLTLIVGFCFGWAVCREYTIRQTAQQLFTLRAEREAIEQKARERELSLIDTYLRRQNVAPLEVQRENTVKLPDPETTVRDWVSDAFRQDEIKEMVELLHPDAAWVSDDEAKAQYFDTWQQCEQQWEEQHTPLRAA